MTKRKDGDCATTESTDPDDMIATGGPVLKSDVATLYNRTGLDIVPTPLDSVNFIFH